MKNPVRTGTMIAIAAGTLFAAACSKGNDPASSSTTPTTGEKTAAVHCAGVNSCKGQGACKSAQNGCKGQNACKGQGWVDSASQDECTSKGGSVVP